MPFLDRKRRSFAYILNQNDRQIQSAFSKQEQGIQLVDGLAVQLLQQISHSAQQKYARRVCRLLRACALRQRGFFIALMNNFKHCVNQRLGRRKIACIMHPVCFFQKAQHIYGINRICAAEGKQFSKDGNIGLDSRVTEKTYMDETLRKIEGHRHHSIPVHTKRNRPERY